MRISDWSSDVCSSDLAREDVLALLDVRALETDDERNREVHFLRRGDDALGDDVALHDAAEDVDEDAFDRGVLQNDLERRRHLSLLAPPPTSRKFAGKAPFSLMMSIVAIARPAPLTMQPMLPSSLM